MVGRTTSRTLIGRESEQARVDAALRMAADGSPVTLLITGEAGIGKTRLLAELLSRVEGEAVVLAGACVDEHVPYLPIADCLRSLHRSRWRPATDDDWGELAALVPGLAPTDAQPRDGDSPGRLQHAFLRLIESFGPDRPVILVVEDLHWSDASTRNLLMYVIRAATDVPLLIVGTYRTDELTRQHPVRPFLAEVTRLPRTEVVELERLDRSDVARLLTEIVGETPSQQDIEDLHARCGGNPFLAEEVAAVLGPSSSGVPQRLHEILLARTSALSADAAELLRVAAVGGVHVDDRLLRTVCALSASRVDAALRELLDAHVLVSDAETHGYAFRHALTAEAVYEDALPGERTRLHGAFAQALSDHPDLAYAGGALAALERARHWHRARNSREELPAWVEAATAAEGVHAFPEALVAYERALELWPAIADAEAIVGMNEVELLRRAAETANWAADRTRAVTLGEHALALVDPDAEPRRAAVVVERLSRYSWLLGRERDALAYAEQAVALVPEEPATPERARALAGHALVQSLMWLDEGALLGARQAIDVAREVGATAVEGHALTTLAVAEAHRGAEDEAIAALDESARLTIGTTDDENIWRLWVNRAYILFGLGRLEAAAACVPHGRAVLRDLGLHRSAGPHAATNEALPLVDLGRWDEARAILDEQIAYASSDWSHAMPLQVRAWLNWLTGDLEGAERDLTTIRRIAPTPEAVQYVTPLEQAVAAVAIETEHWEAAAEAASQVVRVLPTEDGRPVVHWETLTVAWLGLWAAAELVRERGAGATALLAPHLAELDRLLDAADRRPANRRPVRHSALVALCRAEQGRVEGTASRAAWRRAIEANDLLGTVAQRAYARVRLAEALLSEGGDRAEVAAALDEAVSLFALAPRSPIRALAEGVARRARLRLTDQDAAKPQSAAAGFGLTEREREVLGLLAEARTNREIGEELFMSPKTASVHVSSLMRKLGVNRRADAARLAKQVLVEETPPNS